MLVSSGQLEQPPEWRPVSHEEMAEALSACGLIDVTIEYDDEARTDFVEIGDTEISDAELTCAFHTQDRTGYFLNWHESTWPRYRDCLLYTSPSPRDLSTSRMPSSA